MIELWSLVGDESLPFSAGNGAPQLERHFRRVERRDVEGMAVFSTRESLLGYLDSCRRLYEEGLAQRLPKVELPFRARRRNAVFVADR